MMKNIARPYIAMASISTTKSRVLPNISGFSAIAPMAAALAVPRPMPAPHEAKPAAIPAPTRKNPLSLTPLVVVAACEGLDENATATIEEIVMTPTAIKSMLKVICRLRFISRQHLLR